MIEASRARALSGHDPAKQISTSFQLSTHQLHADCPAAWKHVRGA